MKRALCLCCGSRYEPGGDCPRLDELPHSAELAYEVAKFLRGWEIETPTGDDVRLAVEMVRHFGE